MSRPFDIETLKQMGVESNSVAYHRPATKATHKDLLTKAHQLLGGMPGSLQGTMTVDWGPSYEHLSLVGSGVEITLHPKRCQVIQYAEDGVRIENFQAPYELALWLHSHVSTIAPEVGFLDALNILSK